MFTGQNCGISYVADNPIINVSKIKYLERNSESVKRTNGYIKRVQNETWWKMHETRGISNYIEGFMSLELKLQKNINVSLE